MPFLLSKIARKLGLLAIHIVVVREHQGGVRILESSFPHDHLVDVEVHLSIPQFPNEKERELF
ncbi:hypothetical protein N7540_012513 [Penicillium herquei]|nr:hypothetical protein N7540_012513 [Penicillium herquei]